MSALLKNKPGKRSGISNRTAAHDTGSPWNESGETKGLLKALVDPVTKLILGVSVIGPWCGEIMSILQMAMMGSITYVQLRDAIFAHPTYAESINNLFSQLDQPQS